MVSAGRILIIPKGNWNNLASYTMLDLVTAPNGVAYLARQSSVGVNPVTDTSHTYWQAFGTSVTPDGETIVADSNNAIAVNLDNQTLVVDGNVKVNIDDNTLKYDSTNGYLYVELDLSELSNVNVSGITDGQTLIYNATSQKWVNADISTTLSGLTDVQITSVANGQTLVYDSTSSKWVNGTASGGLMPKLLITSEAGSTITVTKGGTSYNVISATTTTWECEVDGYGTYTVTSVLDGDSAVVSAVVDACKIVEVNASHFSSTITVYAPVGATLTVSASGESYSGVGSGETGTSFTVHQKSTTYTVTSVLDGVSKSGTATTTTTEATYTVTLEYGLINLTYETVFQGATLTVTDGTTTFTKTAPSSGTTVSLYPPNTGTWTISAEYSGTTYYTEAVITSLSTSVNANLITIPEGSTVTPTDDIQTWLQCAAISESYTTLSDVLADSTTLLALISNNNAVDYMVRSTTWASDVCANQTAMTDIGANNYCADTLLADSTWLTAICNSTYFESVLNVKVPTLSSDSDKVIKSSESAGYQAWKVFDGVYSSDTDRWMGTTSTAYNATYTGTEYVGYDFTEPVMVCKTEVYGLNNGLIYSYKIQGSNDNSTWDDLIVVTGVSIGASFDRRIMSNVSEYRYCRIQVTSQKQGIVNSTFPMPNLVFTQFYGREDV